MKVTNTVHELAQGSELWHAHRAAHFNASEAAAALGLSKYQTRSQLLAAKTSGMSDDPTPAEQARFDRGHEYEAAARPLAEAIVGTDLYPATVSAVIEGLLLSASLDGLDAGETLVWEHKSLAAALAASIEAGIVPDSHWPQLEQQLLVTGATRCLFMASNGTEETERHVWYESRPERRRAVIDGWKQFDLDLAEFKPQASVVTVTGRALTSLPALSVRLVGQVTESNLTLYRSNALTFIDSIKTDLQTDQDFADAEANLKFCGDAEKQLETVKSAALTQTSSIDELFRTIDVLKSAMRDKRLMLEKLVKARKDSIRVEIANEGKAAIGAHATALKKRLGRPLPMMADDADIVGAMRGKKTLASLRDAVATEVARFKIAANEVADRMDENQKRLSCLIQGAAAPVWLFDELDKLTDKAPDDFEAIAKIRITEHVAAEAKREADMRARIEAERVAKELVEAATQLVAAALPVAADPVSVHEPSPVVAASPAAAFGKMRAGVIAATAFTDTERINYIERYGFEWNLTKTCDLRDFLDENIYEQRQAARSFA